MGKAFSEEELKVIGSYLSTPEDLYYAPGAEPSKLNTPVTPRENWKLFFESRDPLWIPDGTYDLNAQFPKISPDMVAQSHSGGYDAFGVKWVPDISCPDLPAFVEPGFVKLEDIADWRELEINAPEQWDWDAAAEAYSVLDPDRMNEYFLQAGMFERMIAVLGFENAAVAFLEDPDSAHSFLDAVTEFDISLMEHVRKYLKTDILLFSDDWGAQRSPFFSKAVVEEFLAPRMAKLAKRAHELGMYFGHHCCGNVVDFVPYMIDEGVDFWQVNYGAVKNSLEDVIAKYGDRIKFDAYFNLLEVMPQDEEIFKKGAADYYRKFGKSKNCSITVYDYYYDWDFDSRKYLYRLARETAQLQY